MALIAGILLYIYDAKVDGMLNLSVKQQKARFAEEKAMAELKEKEVPTWIFHRVFFLPFLLQLFFINAPVQKTSVIRYFSVIIPL